MFSSRASRASALPSCWLTGGAALAGAATVLVATDRQRKLLGALGVRA